MSTLYDQEIHPKVMELKDVCAKYGMCMSVFVQPEKSQHIVHSLLINRHKNDFMRMMESFAAIKGMAIKATELFSRIANTKH